MRKFIYRGAALAFALTLLIGASTAFAVGESPTEGIPMSIGSAQVCVPQTVAPGASIWLKVSYHVGTDVELFAHGADNLSLSVYYPQQVAGFPALGSPVGMLTSNNNTSPAGRLWRGHVDAGIQESFIYVLVKNTTNAPVTFTFCTVEVPQFFPPAGPWPVDPCALINSGVSTEEGRGAGIPINRCCRFFAAPPGALGAPVPCTPI